METLVGKVVVVERESGSAERLQAAGFFFALSHAAATISPGRQSSPLESTAQAMRACLLAIATTSTLRGALASRPFIQPPIAKRSRFIRIAAARAPWISTLRR